MSDWLNQFNIAKAFGEVLLTDQQLGEICLSSAGEWFYGLIGTCVAVWPCASSDFVCSGSLDDDLYHAQQVANVGLAIENGGVHHACPNANHTSSIHNFLNSVPQDSFLIAVSIL